MTNQDAEFVWRAEYLPFGELFSNTIAEVENNLRFPGQYFDQETGLHQNWFRDYSPKTGRYMEADPIGLGASPNLFAYTEGNPLTGSDPLGLVRINYDIRYFPEPWRGEGLNLFFIDPGKTFAFLPVVGFQCTGCGNTWKLQFNATIRADVHFRESARAHEQRHVDRFSMLALEYLSYFLPAERRTYGSEQECRRIAEQTILENSNRKFDWSQGQGWNPFIHFLW
jgi:RHS repeat-associated protein